CARGMNTVMLDVW
nr:immunoglobulin heavy chain junction region [Macaca mulatta]